MDITPSSSSQITAVTWASTEQVIGHVPEAVEADIDAAVGAARRAFDDPNGWAHWEPAQRAATMERLASALDKRAGEMVRRISSQNGMPVAVANQLEAVFPALLLRYYAGLVNDDTFEEYRPRPTRRHHTGPPRAARELAAAPSCRGTSRRRLAFMKLAPALAAWLDGGAETVAETVLDSFLLAEAIAEAELPAGVVNIVPGGRGTGAYRAPASAGGQDRFHRVDRGRSCHRRNLRSAAWAGHPGAGGQVGGDRAGRRRLDLPEIAQQMFTATLLNNGQNRIPSPLASGRRAPATARSWTSSAAWPAP